MTSNQSSNPPVSHGDQLCAIPPVVPPFVAVITGAAGSGKTSLAKALVSRLNQSRCPTCLVDKDTVSDPLSSEILRLLGVSVLDRDSDVFRREVRHLEYQAALAVAQENAELGLNVVLPGPWTQEIQAGWFFPPRAGELFPRHRVLVFALRADADTLHARIVARGNRRDTHKLAHWETFVQRIDQANRLADLPHIIALPSGCDTADLLEVVLQALLK